MPAVIPRTLFFCLIILVCSKLPEAFAADKVPGCKAAYQTAIQAMLEEVDRLENLYVVFRWTEAKIRLMTYNDLWQARQDSLDPLSKEKRAEGNHQDGRLMALLKTLEKQSSEASSGLWQGLQNFSRHETGFQACCPEKNFKECIHTALKPFFIEVDAGRRLFDLIFERERDFRKEVELTAAGREGHYLEDALEEKAKHADYFARYEMARRAQHYQDDRDMIYFFRGLKKLLTDRFAGDECCYACGPPSLLASLSSGEASKTDWEAKTERLFQ